MHAESRNATQARRKDLAPIGLGISGELGARGCERLSDAGKLSGEFFRRLGRQKAGDAHAASRAFCAVSQRSKASTST